MSKKKTKEQIICDFKRIHGDKYDYSKVIYNGAHSKVCIICPLHGEFYQTPASHLSGRGCPMCVGQNKTTKEWVEKANEVNNGRYSYSKANYVDSKTKICIICPEHGEFWLLPYPHLNGKGCPKCGVVERTKLLSSQTSSFVVKSNKIHHDKYDYSKVKYTNNKTKVCIICPKHGEFLQSPSKHLQGQGCPKCGIENSLNLRKHDTMSFIKKAKLIHGNKYTYDNVIYINAKKNVCITCPKHGEFYQTPDAHIAGHGCPKCSHSISQPENEITNLLSSLNPQQRNRDVLNGKEIDIYIPSLNLGIEYNGLRWHSEEFGKDRSYHLNKLNECNKKGIRLIQIFEDEWINHREICESKLKQICGLNNNPKIYARKCEIREIKNKNEAYEFLNKNHIQGRTGYTLALGAYFKDNIVGVMAFKKEKEGYWDLNRFATDINYQCIGLGGKLFKYFTRNYNFEEIKSFADRRWTINANENLYTKLGFDFESFIRPNYWYFNQIVSQYERFHKFNFRKHTLHNKYGLPLTMTEREMTETLGYTRIWDCGLIKYVFRKVKPEV